MSAAQASVVVREPVLLRTAAVAVLTALLHMLVVRGWLPLEAESEAFVAGLVDLLGFAVAAFWSRQAVTPVKAPNTEALLDAAIEQREQVKPVVSVRTRPGEPLPEPHDGPGSTRI